MRIGFDAKRAFFNRSGLGNYSRFVIKSLIDFYPKDNYLLFTPKLSNRIRFFNSQDNIEVISPDKLLHKKLSSYWRSMAMAKDFKKLQLDIFHGLSGELPKSISNSTVRSVVTIHDLIFLRYPELYKAIDRKIYEKKFRFACNVSDKVIAISEQTKRDIIEFLGTEEAKIEVIYQGCDMRFQQDAPEAIKNEVKKIHTLPNEYLLYVGTIEKRKNLLSIVKAIHMGKIEVPLVIVGKKTSYYNEVEAYIRQYKLENIYFLNNVTNAHLPAIYQMASVFIYPSVFEGFGIPILEALYSKVPVITSKGSCFSEAGGPFSIYIDPNEPEAIAAGIHRILNQPEFKEKMVSEGFAYAQNFDHKLLVKKLNNLYTQLYNER